MNRLDLEESRTKNSFWHFHPPQQPDCLGSVKSLSDCCGALGDRRGRLRRQGSTSLSNPEINSFEFAKSLEAGSNCLNRRNRSSIESTMENNEVRLLFSVDSTSRTSEQKKVGRAAGTSSCDSGSDNPKDCSASLHSQTGASSTQNVLMKSDVSMENRKLLIKNSSELIKRNLHDDWLNIGEDALKRVQASYQKKRLKTESSSSNSTHLIHSAASKDSCQETSVDTKSCEQIKHCDTDASSFNNSKCSLDKGAIRSPVSAQVVSPQSQDNSSKAFARAVLEHHNKLGGVIVNDDPVITSSCEILNLANRGNQDLPLVKSCYNKTHPCKVDQRISGQVEQGVVMYKEACGSCSLGQDGSGDSGHLNSVDSGVSMKHFPIGTKGEVQLNNVGDNCHKLCSNNNKLESGVSLRSEEMSLEVKKLYHTSSMMLSHLSVKAEARNAGYDPFNAAGIHLSESTLASEVDYPEKNIGAAQLVSKPTPVVAKTGYPICLPTPNLQLDHEDGGWRGSAATSAFRPTSFPGSFGFEVPSTTDNSNNHSLRSSRHNLIDLNISVDVDDCDTELLTNKFARPQSCFPSKDSSLEIVSMQPKRFSIDLNSGGENDEECHEVSLPASVPRKSPRDFDLNDNANFADVCCETDEQNQETPISRQQESDDPVITLSRNVIQPESSFVDPLWTDSGPTRSSSYGHAKPFLLATPYTVSPSPVGQVQGAMSLNQPSPHVFPYHNAYFIDSNNHLSSTIHHSGVIPCLTYPRPTTFFPRMLGSTFSGGSRLVSVAGGSNFSDAAMVRPSFDPSGRQGLLLVQNPPNGLFSTSYPVYYTHQEEET
ncbi:hypothetical protein K2173_007088 [Erythroxylum novogranatense]|uniref:Uncharacterized protein n=1 Tax=Erythroxylum novogranatense TaxID=1862640 RepID=A0AAV8SYB6_9ROSI|nr:hypothetical protein K2173_007088 [Erythroxylum novogranatense]